MLKKRDENWRNIRKIRFAKIAKKGRFSIFSWETSPDSDNRVWEQKAHQCRHVHGATMFTSNYFGKHVCYKVHEIILMCCTISACQEQMRKSMQFHYTPVTPFSKTDLFSDRICLEWAWECHDQLQEINWLNCVIGPELSSFTNEKIC